MDIDLSLVKQVYCCANPNCPTGHYVPNEGPFEGKVWYTNTIFPTRKEDWATSFKDTCGMSQTRATNDLVNQQLVRKVQQKVQQRQRFTPQAAIHSHLP